MSNTERILLERDEAERKAWDALSRYKFWMFGYWAAIWVHLNRVGKFGGRSPFAELVLTARNVVRGRADREREGVA